MGSIAIEVRHPPACLGGVLRVDEVRSVYVHSVGASEVSNRNRLGASAVITLVISANRVRDSGRILLSAQTRRRIYRRCCRPTRATTTKGGGGEPRYCAINRMTAAALIVTHSVASKGEATRAERTDASMPRSMYLCRLRLIPNPPAALGKRSFCDPPNLHGRFRCRDLVLWKSTFPTAMNLRHLPV